MADKAAVYRGQQYFPFLFMSTTLWKRFPVNFFSVERVVMFQRFRALFGKRVPKPLSGLFHVDLGLKYLIYGSIIHLQACSIRDPVCMFRQHALP